MPRKLSTPLARAHAFITAQNVFTSFIDVHCSLVTRSGSWIVVYNSGSTSVADVQNALGHRAARGRYNLRNVKRVMSTKRALETELNGFSDLWVPVVGGQRVEPSTATTCWRAALSFTPRSRPRKFGTIGLS